MPSQETTFFARLCFEQQERIFGYTNPTAVAQALAMSDHGIFLNIKRVVQRMPTQVFLYEGAKDTLRSLFQTGDHVAIWTQGNPRVQLWKIANSGLSSIKKETEGNERRRFSVYAADDKIQHLPSVINDLEKKGVKKIIIVDDKSENIINTDNQIGKWKTEEKISNNVDIQLVWINQGRTRNQVPEGFTPESFAEAFTTITDIQDLETIKAQNNNITIGWLIDLDHTLLNTSLAKEKMFETLAVVLEESAIISPIIDRKLGLNGNVRSIEELKNGMSGGRVTKIETDNGTIVVKYNPDQPEKVRREIQGYERLKQTPLGQHLAIPQEIDETEPFITLPYYNGVQMRNGIQEGIVSEVEAKNILSLLLDAKINWWTNQPKVFPNGDLVSMQRLEWQDTVQKTLDAVSYLSEKFKIPKEDFWKSPLVFQGNIYPPLLVLMGQIEQFLKQPPPYAVLAHGDVTGANIIYNPDDKKITIIDAEWVGYADPAEAFIRMSKYISTTTVKTLSAVDARLENGLIYVNYDLTFPKSAIGLQNTGLKRMNDFTNALKDKDFPRRSNRYLAGSYLRELALASRRGNPDFAMFAMIKAGEAYQM